MSDLLNRPPPSRGVKHAGFSLLEVLTVLFIIGTAAALVTPNLPLLMDRLLFATQRESVVREINSLPYAALKTGQNLILIDSPISTSNALTSAPTDEDVLDLLSRYPDINSSSLLTSLRPAALNLPDGWSVSAPEPIFYKPTGFCTGGTLTLTAQQLTYEFELKPPYCQVGGAPL